MNWKSIMCGNSICNSSGTIRLDDLLSSQSHLPALAKIGWTLGREISHDGPGRLLTVDEEHGQWYMCGRCFLGLTIFTTVEILDEDPKTEDRCAILSSASS